MKNSQSKITGGIFISGLMIFFASQAAFSEAGSRESLAGMGFAAPASWKKTEPSSSMRAYQYEVPAPEGQGASGELAVFYFGEGQGGDIEENIARWKGQFTQVDNEHHEAKDRQGLKVTEVQMQGTYQVSGGPMMAASGEPKKDYALLGAIVEAPQGAVFFKLTGPKQTLDHAKPDFETFLSSLSKG